jgi:hypothetical protein
VFSGPFPSRKNVERFGLCSSGEHLVPLWNLCVLCLLWLEFGVVFSCGAECRNASNAIRAPDKANPTVRRGRKAADPA